MTSVEIKERLLFCLLYRMGYHAAFTEMQNADIYAITRSRYSHEFEIKISKSDLMSELNLVKDLVLFGEPKKAYSKRWKHERYLGVKKDFLSVDMPNYFSFVVPEELTQAALEILKGTPYGLYEYTGGIYKKKRAEYLHKEKVSDKMFFYLLRKASTEVQTLVIQHKCSTVYLVAIYAIPLY